MITRKEFNEMSFEEVWKYCCKQSDSFTDRETLKASAIQRIQLDDIDLALHILHALDDFPKTKYFHYIDGTTCNLTTIRDKEDLEAYIDIEEGKQAYLVKFTGTQVVEVDVDSSMTKEDIERKVREQLCNYAEFIEYIVNNDTDETLVEYSDEAEI